MCRSWYVHIYAYINETFYDNEGLRDVAPCFVNASFGCCSFTTAIFFMIFPNWRILMIFYTGMPSIAMAGYFYYYIKKHKV